jgi:hypothetical protein
MLQSTIDSVAPAVHLGDDALIIGSSRPRYMICRCQKVDSLLRTFRSCEVHILTALHDVRNGSPDTSREMSQRQGARAPSSVELLPASICRSLERCQSRERNDIDTPCRTLLVVPSASERLSLYKPGSRALPGYEVSLSVIDAIGKRRSPPSFIYGRSTCEETACTVSWYRAYCSCVYELPGRDYSLTPQIRREDLHSLRQKRQCGT